MGLDMYLFKTKNGKYDNDINDQIGYWRKANEIHKWFVDNVQNGVDDCDIYPVSRENLIELAGICLKILSEVKLTKGKIVSGYKLTKEGEIPIYIEGAVIDNPEICKELLPTKGGFFFGSTEYNSFYYDDVKDTLKICATVLADTDFDEYQVYYTSSW